MVGWSLGAGLKSRKPGALLCLIQDVERFYRAYYLRPKQILRIIKTMLEDKDVCVRRLREGYEFFKSMAQRRTDLAAAKAAA